MSQRSEEIAKGLKFYVHTVFMKRESVIVIERMSADALGVNCQGDQNLLLTNGVKN